MWLREQAEKLCGRSAEYDSAYSPPRRALHEQHARPDDARDEPLLRPRPAPARLARRLPSPLRGLGPAGELRLLASGDRARERGLAMPRRTPQSPSLPRRLAPEPEIGRA